MKKLSEMLSPKSDSSDSEDDLPKTSLIQLGKYKIIVNNDIDINWKISVLHKWF